MWRDDGLPSRPKRQWGHPWVAAATPKGGIVMHADGWPEKLEPGDVALAVAEASESAHYAGDTILTGLLGAAGLAAHAEDAARRYRASSASMRS